MKSGTLKSGIISFMWVLTFLLLDVSSYSQQEIARDSVPNSNLVHNLPGVIIRQTINDTVLPTLSNSGKGLIHAKSVLLRLEDRSYNYSIMGDRIKKAVRADWCTEEELKALHEQLRLIEEYYNYQLQQQIRNDKMDLHLGEIIKGFYIKPVF